MFCFAASNTTLSLRKNNGSHLRVDKCLLFSHKAVNLMLFCTNKDHLKSFSPGFLHTSPSTIHPDQPCWGNPWWVGPVSMSPAPLPPPCQASVPQSLNPPIEDSMATPLPAPQKRTWPPHSVFSVTCCPSTRAGWWCRAEAAPHPAMDPQLTLTTACWNYMNMRPASVAAGPKPATVRRPELSGVSRRIFDYSREVEDFWRDCLAA